MRKAMMDGWLAACAVALEQLPQLFLCVDEDQLLDRLDLFYSPSVSLGGLFEKEKQKRKRKANSFTCEVESLFLCPDFKEFAGPHDIFFNVNLEYIMFSLGKGDYFVSFSKLKADLKFIPMDLGDNDDANVMLMLILLMIVIIVMIVLLPVLTVFHRVAISCIPPYSRPSIIFKRKRQNTLTEFPLYLFPGASRTRNLKIVIRIDPIHPPNPLVFSQKRLVFDHLHDF